MDEVLSTLGSRHVRATFFVNGAHVAEAPQVARRLVAAGHELGNHTYSHERMVLRSQAFIASQVGRTDELIRAAGQQGEIYFRPPFCWKLVGLPWFLWRTGRTTVTWDIDALASKRFRPSKNRVRMHATRPAKLDHTAPRLVSEPIRVAGRGAPHLGSTSNEGVSVCHDPGVGRASAAWRGSRMRGDAEQ